MCKTEEGCPRAGGGCEGEGRELGRSCVPLHAIGGFGVVENQIFFRNDVLVLSIAVCSKVSVNRPKGISLTRKYEIVNDPEMAI